MPDKQYLKKYIRELLDEVEEELEESTATGAVDGYQTPHAFSGKNNDRRKKTATQAGYTIVDGDVENITESISKSDVKIEKSMTGFWNVYVWKNSWITFSKHRFESSAKEVMNAIISNKGMNYVEKLIKKQNKTSASEIIANTQEKNQINRIIGESINEDEVEGDVENINEAQYRHPHQNRSNWPKSNMPDEFDIELKDTLASDPHLKNHFWYIDGYELKRMGPGGSLGTSLMLKKNAKVKDVIKQLKKKMVMGYESVNEDEVEGGLADKKSLEDIANHHKVDIDTLLPEFKDGIKVEMEHTKDPNIAAEIAMDHLYEDPKYYTKLATIEPEHESINEAKWSAYDGRIWNGKKPVMGYEFDSDSDSFWVNQKTKRGQKSFDEKEDMIKWAKKNPKEWEWKSESVNEEKVYIDFLNKKKGFKRDRIKFDSYEKAVKWAKKNFEKFNPDMIHYESVNEGRKPKKEVRRNRWLELKRDETKPNKKLATGLKELKNKLTEIEKFLTWYNKISKMNELSSDSYWKRTNRHIYKIKERLVNIAHTIKELEQ